MEDPRHLMTTIHRPSTRYTAIPTPTPTPSCIPTFQPRNQPLDTSPLLAPHALFAAQFSTDLKHRHGAIDTARCDPLALRLLPRDAVQALAEQAAAALARAGRGLGDGDLGVDVEVPDLEAAGAVDEGEDARFEGRPGGVVDDVFAGQVQQRRDGVRGVADDAGRRRRGGGAHAPELDGPVEGAGEEEVRQVDGAAGWVEGEGHDRGGVAFVGDALVHARFGACAVVPVAWVDGAFFGADEEVGRVGLGEGHAGWGEVFGLGGWWGRQEEVFLREGEHVDCPAADDAVG